MAIILSKPIYPLAPATIFTKPENYIARRLKISFDLSFPHFLPKHPMDSSGKVAICSYDHHVDVINKLNKLKV